MRGDGKPTIYEVCAAHLEGNDLVASKGLTLLPFSNGAACGQRPCHSKAFKALVTKAFNGVIGTVEKAFPADTGRIRVRALCQAVDKIYSLPVPASGHVRQY